MASEKTVVIAYLWDMLNQEGTGRRIVNREDVVRAIEHCREAHKIKLSVGNPANFMKDVVRGDNANDFWPPSLAAKRITARQRPSGERIFEFIDYEDGQTEPFPNKYDASPDMASVPVEAVSLSLAKRSLGRRDESWLIQVAVELRLVETHFATRSKQPFEEVSHLQTGVKLGTSEIDSLFLAHLRTPDGTLQKALITCEAKQEGQRILDHQIVEQVVAASKSVRAAGMDIALVIPMAIKATQGGRIYIAEFEPWDHADTDKPEADLKDIELASEAVYELRPPVPGIGHKNSRATRPGGSPKARRTTADK